MYTEPKVYSVEFRTTMLRLRHALEGGHRSLFGRTVRDGRTLFMALDQNKDGAVSREEIAGGLHRLGIQMDTTRAETLMEEIPLDTSGSLPHGSVYAHRCGLLCPCLCCWWWGVTGCCAVRDWKEFMRASKIEGRRSRSDPNHHHHAQSQLRCGLTIGRVHVPHV